MDGIPQNPRFHVRVIWLDVWADDYATKKVFGLLVANYNQFELVYSGLFVVSSKYAFCFLLLFSCVINGETHRAFRTTALT